jgi:hypothetical protein
MIFTGIRKDEKGELVEYELKLYKQDIACLYQDRYGVYVSTASGKLYKVKSSLEDLDKELNELYNT